MKINLILILVSIITIVAQAETYNSGVEDRLTTVQMMNRIARPVLVALGDNTLGASLPEFNAKRNSFAPLEALGRTVSGIAPWLELGPDGTQEGKLRSEMIALTIKGISNAVDPASSGKVDFSAGSQALVDAAFLAQGLLSAPQQIWGNLSEQAQTNVINALKQTRKYKPHQCNWLLFSAIREAAIWQFTGECQVKDIEYAVNKHLEWYKGDGVYGDGPHYRWDYYNSFVIQPMLLDVVKVCELKNHPLKVQYALILKRAVRYAEVQEKLISPEGSFPVIGRSSVYRIGAFQTLSKIALMQKLPADIAPATVRSALCEVTRRVMEAPGTFDDKGWLRPGVVGFQPDMADSYISTGSLYLCTLGMVHLGLPASDPLWTEPGKPWTQKKIWSGQNVKGDHAQD